MGTLAERIQTLTVVGTCLHHTSATFLNASNRFTLGLFAATSNTRGFSSHVDESLWRGTGHCITIRGYFYSEVVHIISFWTHPDTELVFITQIFHVVIHGHYFRIIYRKHPSIRTVMVDAIWQGLGVSFPAFILISPRIVDAPSR